jgi:hypothetical protein
MTAAGILWGMRAAPLLAASLLAAAGCKAGPAGSAPSAAAAPCAPPAASGPSDPALAAEPVLLGAVDGRGGPGGKPPAEDVRARRRVTEDDAFWAEKHDTARHAAAVGDDEAALSVISAALALKPPSAWEERFKNLRSNVKMRHVQVDVLRADARGVKDFVTFGAAADFLVRLRNVSGRDLTLRPPTAGGLGEPEVSGSALFLEVRRKDHDIYGAVLTRSWTQRVPLVGPQDDAIVVPAEGVREVRVRIPPEDAGEPISGLRAIEVSGDVRVSRVEAGISEPVNRVPIRAGRVVVLPGGFEPVAADPLGSLDKALDASALVHVLVAAEFVAPADRVRAVRRMADALATGPAELRPPIRSALALYREESGRAEDGGPSPEALAPLVAPLIQAIEAHPERTAEIGEAITALAQVSLAPDARLWQEWWRRGASPQPRKPANAPPGR